MNRAILICFAAVSIIAMSGCAAYDNEAMAGDAVDIPDPTPLSQEAPVITAPSPTPAPAASSLLKY